MNPDLLAEHLPHPIPRPNWRAVWAQQSQRAVLFDLDGTLLDTAADLGGAANAMRVDRGLDPLPLADLRPYASRGARGLIQKSFGVEWDTPEFEPLKHEFLERYEAALADQTQFMEGLDSIVNDLERRGVPWGSSPISSRDSPTLWFRPWASTDAWRSVSQATPRLTPNPILSRCALPVSRWVFIRSQWCMWVMTIGTS